MVATWRTPIPATWFIAYSAPKIGPTSSTILKDSGNIFGGIARQKNIPLLAAGGTANHLHLLLSLPPTITLAKAVQELKGNTSRWLNEMSRFPWQKGYSAFSVSQSQRKTVVDHRPPGRTPLEMELRTGIPDAAQE